MQVTGAQAQGTVIPRRFFDRQGKVGMFNKKSTEKQIAMQTARVREMESILDRSDDAMKALDEALTRYEEVLGDYRSLEDYYGSPEWRDDFEADEEGLLPADLKRGVLSEDAVYDLIAEHKKLLIRMSHLVHEFQSE